MTLAVELLEPARVKELWPSLEPLFVSACAGNEIGSTDLTAQDIYNLATNDSAVIFAFFEQGVVVLTIAIQFHTTNGKKGADIIAMAGKNLVKFKAAYWQPILSWLKANNVQFVDAYANQRLAKIYLSRFGFNKSCTLVRMML